jgi:5-methylcytosine-specific restriction endonuclease McrA
MNMYKCKITGESYSEAKIQQLLSKTYREWYEFTPQGACEGCGRPGMCTAHIIPKARCKQLQLTSLIWNPENWFRACYTCNMCAENPDTKEIRDLRNFQEILAVYRQYDMERYQLLLSCE